ncbi:hypothetical protein SAY87_016959 [Trapa incisa]|uniref:C2H2-type domain-containing protein n=1 Tax=Trapa incisa TaxID=236973 RepID=A0AAN7L263_9MYRT|nr:hypothetical protein SAY87_016959 [Trapa incisa]
MNKDQKMMRGTAKSFCSKRHSHGKSFTGHLRAHKIGINSSMENFSKVCEDIKNGRGYFSFEDGGSSGYGLRKKKSRRRLVDSVSPALHGHGCSNVCKECGKGFQSLKALCGHMACHSEKASGWSSEDEDISDQIVEGNKVFRSVTESDQCNGYSSSETEQEQEELAKCLMMLSRDDRRVQAPNLYDSLVLESKSSPIHVMARGSDTGGVNSASGFMENMEMEKLHKTRLKASEILANSHKSNAGYLKIKVPAEPRRAKDISNAVHSGKKYGIRTEHMQESPARKNNPDNPKSPRDGISCAGGHEYTLTNAKQMHQCDICSKLFNSHKALRGHKSAASCYRKVELSRLPQSNTKVHNHQSSRNLSLDWKKTLGTKKSYRHECPICSRVFKSGQALGGHKRSHFLGSSEIRSMAIGSEVDKVHNLMDLNLPAAPCSASFHF